MNDDVGYGAPDTFGGPIHTPTLSKLASHGVTRWLWSWWCCDFFVFFCFCFLGPRSWFHIFLDISTSNWGNDRNCAYFSIGLVQPPNLVLKWNGLRTKNTDVDLGSCFFGLEGNLPPSKSVLESLEISSKFDGISKDTVILWWLQRGQGYLLQGGGKWRKKNRSFRFIFKIYQLGVVGLVRGGGVKKGWGCSWGTLRIPFGKIGEP